MDVMGSISLYPQSTLSVKPSFSLFHNYFHFSWFWWHNGLIYCCQFSYTVRVIGHYPFSSYHEDHEEANFGGEKLLIQTTKPWFETSCMYTTTQASKEDPRVLPICTATVVHASINKDFEKKNQYMFHVRCCIRVGVVYQPYVALVNPYPNHRYMEMTITNDYDVQYQHAFV